MSFLIVDDNENMRGVIREILEDLTDEILDCPTGEEAVGLYGRHRPDWVLMDLRMQGIGGIEATRRIRSAFPDARIAIVTDHDEPELRSAAMEAGAAHFVSKEDLFLLRRIVRKI